MRKKKKRKKKEKRKREKKKKKVKRKGTMNNIKLLHIKVPFFPIFQLFGGIENKKTVSPEKKLK